MRIRSFACALALAAAALLAVSAPASAHDALVSTTPQDGATVEVLPDAVALTFSDPVPPASGDANEIKVTDAAGTVLNDGPLVIQDAVVSQPIAGGVAGPVQVLWRVVSQDGHPVSGSFTFTVKTSPSPTAAPEPDATAQPTPTETALIAPSPVTTPAPAPIMAAASPLPWVIAGGVVVVVAAGIAIVLAGRSRKRRDQ